MRCTGAGQHPVHGGRAVELRGHRPRYHGAKGGPGMSPRAIYTSTVTSWPTAVGTAVATAGAAAAVLITATSLDVAGLTACAVGFALIALVAGVHLGTVRLTVTADRIGVGSGVQGRTRWLPVRSVELVEARRISWPMVFGFGLPRRDAATRLTVRAGATLRVRVGREDLWISAKNPETAAGLLTRR